jgi:penicillin-binding protein 2
MLKGFGGRSLIVVAVLLLVSAVLAKAAVARPSKVAPAKPKSPSISENSSTKKKISAKQRRRAARRRHRRYYERFYTSSFANDVTAGDLTAGEDPIVRAAAEEALGNMNGTVVAIDPTNGRILTMVNQKLALSEGAQPCSTFKVAVALAALNEGVVEKDTEMRFGRRGRVRMNLTQALATSHNGYFEVLGRRLGFEKVSDYAQMFGIGELAGYNIEGEHLGIFPEKAPTSRHGGVGRMCSFGEDISMTPLQLGAMMAAIANGGTLYYLQHPQSQEEIEDFQPVVKRQLDIAPLIPGIYDGMLGAVEYGTARGLRFNFNEESILGKTGTCSKDGTRYGWFAAYNNNEQGKLVIVVFLRGGRPTFGPKAAEIAGRIYRNLYDNSFFAETTPEMQQQINGIRSTLEATTQ